MTRWQKWAPGHYYDGKWHICRLYGGQWGLDDEIPMGGTTTRFFDTLKEAKAAAEADD